MTLEETRELFEFLRGRGPEGFRLPKRPRLGKRAAATVIYVLQERFRLIPDTFEQCDDCLELFDSEAEGCYDDKTGKHYCASCEAHHPMVDAHETCADGKHAWSGPFCIVCQATRQWSPDDKADATHAPIVHMHALWRHLHEQHGLTLLESELDEIIRLATESVIADETNAPRVECKCDRCGRESFEARMIGVLCGEASYNHVCYGRMRAAPSEYAQ